MSDRPEPATERDLLETSLRELLRERATVEPAQVERVRGTVGALPARRRSLPVLARAAAVVLALGLAAVAVTRVPLGPGGTPAAVDGDPARFVDDPRFARCGGLHAEAEAAFEMARARDYQLHLPAMLDSPELHVDAPAFVVVFKDRHPFGGGGAFVPGSPTPRDPAARDVCVLVGEDPATAALNVYPGVDTTGLTAIANAAPSAPAPSPSGPDGSTDPATAAPLSPSHATIPPWTLGLADQLACSGPVRSIGGEVPDVFEELRGPTPADMEEYLTRTFFDALPGRLELEEAEPHWVRYVHRNRGAPKTVVIATDSSIDAPGLWTIVGLRSCDPSEFDPAVGLAGALLSIWRDDSGNPVSTDVIREHRGPGHCGWDSTIIMRFEGVQFIRDPEAVLRGATVAPYLEDTTLPATAVDSGLRQGNRALWRSADGRYVYVVAGDVVEAWPRAEREIACM